MKEKNFSDQIALEIDRETRKIIEECYEDCKKIITENIDLLNTIAEYLKKVETLTKADIDEIAETLHLKRWDNREQLKAEKAAKEAEEKAKAEANSIICPTCGAKNSIESGFCTNCGRNLESIRQIHKEEIDASIIDTPTSSDDDNTTDSKEASEDNNDINNSDDEIR